MVVAGQGLVVAEMLFKNPRAEQGGDFKHLHIVGQGVIGIADHVLREVADERRDHAERGVFVHRGIVQHAVQQGQRVALGFDPAHGLGDFGKAGRAGGQDDRLVEIAHEFDEGPVRDVRGGNLEDVHHVVEEAGGFHVERRGHEGDPGLIAVLFQGFELALPEGIVLFEQFVLARGGFLGGVPVGRGVLGGEGARLVGLELDGVRAAEGGFVDEAAGDVHAAFVVHSGFGDDVGTLEAGGRNGMAGDEFNEIHKRSMRRCERLRKGFPALYPCRERRSNGRCGSAPPAATNAPPSVRTFSFFCSVPDVRGTWSGSSAS